MPDPASDAAAGLPGADAPASSDAPYAGLGDGILKVIHAFLGYDFGSPRYRPVAIAGLGRCRRSAGPVSAAGAGLPAAGGAAGYARASTKPPP